MTHTMQQARLDIAVAHAPLMAPGRRDLVRTIANGTHREEVRPDRVITGGPTVGQAFHDLYCLERACMNQVMALWTRQPLREVPGDMAIRAEQQYDSQRSEAELHFASLERILAAQDAAFAEPARTGAAA